MAIFRTTRRHHTPVMMLNLVGSPAEREMALDQEPTQDTVAAASDKASIALVPSGWAATRALTILVVGLAVGTALSAATASEGPRVQAVEGVGAFAVFYVVAQAAERLAELASPLVGRAQPLNKRKAGRLRDKHAVAASNDPTDTSAKQAANAQAELDQVTVNRRSVYFAMTAAIGMILCGYLHTDFLRTIGVATPSGAAPTMLGLLISLAVTGLIVVGGSDGLHGLITNLSKSSTQKDKPTESGGTS